MWIFLVVGREAGSSSIPCSGPMEDFLKITPYTMSWSSAGSDMNWNGPLGVNRFLSGTDLIWRLDCSFETGLFAKY